MQGNNKQRGINFVKGHLTLNQGNTNMQDMQASRTNKGHQRKHQREMRENTWKIKNMKKGEGRKTT